MRLDEMTWEQRFYVAFDSLVEMERKAEAASGDTKWRVNPDLMRLALREANARRTQGYLDGIKRRKR